MKIKAIKGYYDRQTQEHVRTGAEYEVDAARGKKLIDLKLAEEAKAPAPVAKEPEPKAEPKKK